MSVDRLRVIEEVRKRPFLWDFRHHGVKRDLVRCAALWTEIGEELNMNATVCKRTWTRLRVQFCNEANRIPIRIAKAKAKGKYIPHKKYYSWSYFDALRFVADGLSPYARFHLNCENNSDSDVEIIERDGTDSTHEFEGSAVLSDSDKDIEFIECSNDDPMQSEKPRYFDNHYESDNDIEIIENNNFDQTESEREVHAQNNFLPEQRDNTSPIIPVDDSAEPKTADTVLKSYRVSLSDCIAQCSERATSLNGSPALQCDSVFKEEPELQIEAENHQTNENLKSLPLSASEQDSCSENSVLLVASNANEQYESVHHISSSSGASDQENEDIVGTLTTPEEHVTSTPCSNDEDYSFLYSFLSQTKAMNQLQKMEFRVNMKNLLVYIFPASASLNILEKQLLLPEEKDPDRKFLISFWPFIKAMTLKQNLQFRAKVADLVFQILSSQEFQNNSKRKRNQKDCK